MNQIVIDMIHDKIDPQLREIPHKFAQEDISVEVHVTITPKV